MIKAADDFANINAKLRELEEAPLEKKIEMPPEDVLLYGGDAGGGMVPTYVGPVVPVTSRFYAVSTAHSYTDTGPADGGADC